MGPAAHRLAGRARGAARPAVDGDRPHPDARGRPGRAPVAARRVRHRPARVHRDVHRGGRLLARERAAWPLRDARALADRAGALVRPDGPRCGRRPARHVQGRARGGRRGVAQVQGVWVEPGSRGLRLSEHGMAAVVELARQQVAPVVSLYVNDYNARAIAAYRAVGFRQVGSYATVLF
ncbi:GNAT family N-acetyltransferase [Cellulomonas sp.]|uniref:GNAT family N-acetyltransferase n=1 Tax=Cellulomonas sp. TaxID=40001 RepID=UPI00338E72C5